MDGLAAGCRRQGPLGGRSPERPLASYDHLVVNRLVGLKPKLPRHLVTPGPDGILADDRWSVRWHQHRVIGDQVDVGFGIAGYDSRITLPLERVERLQVSLGSA